MHTGPTRISHILYTVAFSSSAIERLTFFNGGDVTSFSLRIVLQKCNRLRDLRIFPPSKSTLYILSTEKLHLQYLSLLDITEASLEHGKTFIVENGQLLESLSLSLLTEVDCSDYHFCHLGPDFSPVKDLLEFFIGLEENHFKNLTELNLKLPLHGFCERCMNCLENMFHKYEGLYDIEVERKKVLTVFPANHDEDATHLKSVMLDMTPLFLFHFGFDIFWGIEEGSIESSAVAGLFIREEFHGLLIDVMGKARGSIERFNIRYSFQDSPLQFQESLKFLT